MRVALFTNQNYSKSNYNYKPYAKMPSFGTARQKLPKEINDTFCFLRKKVAQMSEVPTKGETKTLTKEVFSADGEVAKVVVERKNKNWFLSFLFNNSKEGKTADVTHSTGDKTAMQALLKDAQTKKKFNEFLQENGITLGSI